MEDNQKRDLVRLSPEELILVLACARQFLTKGGRLRIPNNLPDGKGGMYEALIDWQRRKIVLLSTPQAFVKEGRKQYRTEFDPEDLKAIGVLCLPTSTNATAATAKAS